MLWGQLIDVLMLAEEAAEQLESYGAEVTYKLVAKMLSNVFTPMNVHLWMEMLTVCVLLWLIYALSIEAYETYDWGYTVSAASLKLLTWAKLSNREREKAA